MSGRFDWVVGVVVAAGLVLMVGMIGGCGSVRGGGDGVRAGGGGAGGDAGSLQAGEYAAMMMDVVERDGAGALGRLMDEYERACAEDVPLDEGYLSWEESEEVMRRLIALYGRERVEWIRGYMFDSKCGLVDTLIRCVMLEWLEG